MIEVPAVVVCNHCLESKDQLYGLLAFIHRGMDTRTFAEKESTHLCEWCLTALKEWLHLPLPGDKP